MCTRRGMFGSRAGMLQSSFRRFWTTAESCGTGGRKRQRIWRWLVRTGGNGRLRRDSHYRLVAWRHSLHCCSRYQFAMNGAPLMRGVPFQDISHTRKLGHETSRSRRKNYQVLVIGWASVLKTTFVTSSVSDGANSRKRYFSVSARKKLSMRSVFVFSSTSLKAA